MVEWGSRCLAWARAWQNQTKRQEHFPADPSNLIKIGDNARRRKWIAFGPRFPRDAGLPKTRLNTLSSTLNSRSPGLADHKVDPGLSGERDGDRRIVIASWTSLASTSCRRDALQSYYSLTSGTGPSYALCLAKLLGALSRSPDTFSKLPVVHQSMHRCPLRPTKAFW